MRNINSDNSLITLWLWRRSSGFDNPLRAVYAPCACAVCVSYCQRPGWWTVEEAARAIQDGYAHRMMLEMSPDRSFGVLAPAFKGNEVGFARNVYAERGCTFLDDVGRILA